MSHAQVEQLRQRASQQIAQNAGRLADDTDEYEEDDFVDDSHGVLVAGLLAAFALGARGAVDGRPWAQETADGQRPYLEDFASEIAQGSVSDAEAAARSDLYAGLTWTGYVRGGVEEQSFGNPEQRYIWEAEDDEATCDDCAGLDGQEFTLDEIDQWPGDGSQQCLGNCRCKLVAA